MTSIWATFPLSWHLKTGIISAVSLVLFSQALTVSYKTFRGVIWRETCFTASRQNWSVKLWWTRRRKWKKRLFFSFLNYYRFIFLIEKNKNHVYFKVYIWHFWLFPFLSLNFCLRNLNHSYETIRRSAWLFFCFLVWTGL